MFRHPDKPIRMYSDLLSEIDTTGGFIATQKLDGWRCVTTIRNGQVTYRSRIDKELPVSEMISGRLAKNMVDNVTLDCEWMKRRPDYSGPECLYVFGITHLNGQWIGHMPELERFKMVLQLILGSDNIDDVQRIVNHNENNIIKVPQFAMSNYGKFFDQQRGVAETEGIVIKRVTSSLIGDLNKSAKNMNWYKVKWRDGAAGRTHVE